MAILFMDGFDQYQTQAEMQQIIPNAGALDSANSRNGGNCARLNSGAIQFPAVATMGIAFALKVSSGTFDFTLYDSVISTQLILRRDSTSGLLSVIRGSTTLATGSVVIPAGVYVHIEMKLLVADSGGTCEVRVNGITDINVTGDTKNTSTADVARVVFGNTGNPTYYIDDLVIWDTSGSANNNFIGDCKVKTLEVNGNGATQQFTLSAGSDQAAVVNDKDSDADYLISSTTDQRSEFTLADLAANETIILAVQMAMRAAKSDAGARSGLIGLRSGAAEVETAMGLSTSFVWANGAIQNVDPSGSVAWTASAVNALTGYARTGA